MPLNKNFNNVVTQKKQNKRQITKLAELNQDDKNTIYNLILKGNQYALHCISEQPRAVSKHFDKLHLCLLYTSN